MKIAIILNGVSRRKENYYRDFHPQLIRHYQVTVHETKHAHHAYQLAADVAPQADVLLAAGGDGTLHQCLNGMLRATLHGSRQPALGVIPLGTGNDYARTVGVKRDIGQLLTLLEKNNPRSTDVGGITCEDEAGNPVNRFFINVCSLGMGPEVVRRLSNSRRRLGPALTYLKAIVTTFFTHVPQPVHIDTPDWSWEGSVRVLAVALGKSFGNAMYIAPDAKVDDGKFNIFIAGALPLVRFLRCLQQIKKCKVLDDSLIHYRECTELTLKATQRTLLEAEGEAVGKLPARVGILTHRIQFLR